MILFLALFLTGCVNKQIGHFNLTNITEGDDINQIIENNPNPLRINKIENVIYYIYGNDVQGFFKSNIKNQKILRIEFDEFGIVVKVSEIPMKNFKPERFHHEENNFYTNFQNSSSENNFTIV